MRAKLVITGGLLAVLGISASLWAAPIQGQGTDPLGARIEREAPKNSDTAFIHFLLTVERAGRYAILATNPQGLDLVLVDQMAGPIGHAEGGSKIRLDRLLDRGSYRIRVKLPEKARDEVTLSVRPFEGAEDGFSTLQPHLVLEENLADFKQKSFWLNLAKDEEVRIEVLGRYLADCRLWRADGWLTAAQPEITLYEPEPGKPMSHIEFQHRLPAGQYLLTCYGGPGQTWSADSDRGPLYLRWGTITWGNAGVHKMVVSPFGRETFQVDGQVNYVELSRAEKKPASLVLRPAISGSSKFGPGATATIDKDSDTPGCVLDGDSGTARQWLIVEAAPGDQLELRYFVRDFGYNWYRSEQKPYWISSLHTAAVKDSVDVTGHLIQAQGTAPIVSQTVKLNSSGLMRRFNLLDQLTLYLTVEDPGTYRIDELVGATAQAEYTIEPMMVQRPARYRAPPAKPAGGLFDLARGEHVLTITPKHYGILAIAMVASTSSTPTGTPPVSHAPGLLWPNLLLPRSGSPYFSFWVSQKDWIPYGMVRRPLPLDLAEPLPIELVPGQSAIVALASREHGRIMLTGDALDLWLGPVGSQAGDRVPAGTHSLTVRNASTTTTSSMLFWLPDLPQPNPGQEPEPLADLGTEPLFRDYARGQQRQFRLQIDEPGLYRLETSGRLSMSLTLRSRVDAALFNAAENGIGRNAQIQQYFKPGDYLVTMTPTGLSQGRAGLHLRRAALLEGPALEPGDINRVSLDADTAISYRLTIKEKAKYRIETLGLEKVFAQRIEEPGGWPLLPPGHHETLEMDLEPGAYTYYSLPQSLPSRRITTLTKVETPFEPRGKGPFTIEFQRTYRNIWNQGEPDVYQLAVSAPAESRIELTAGMKAELHGDGGRVAEITGGSPWQGLLATGITRLLVTRLGEDNRFPYEIRVATSDLIPGVKQEISSLPQTLKLRLAEDAVVDIASFGAADLKGRLLGISGQVLAESDDSSDDWNFLMSVGLAAGEYRLEVLPAGPGRGNITLAMRTRGEIAGQLCGPPCRASWTTAGELVRVPVTITADGLYRIRATAAGGAVLSLTGGAGQLARANGEMLIPLRAGGNYQLQVWSENGQAGTIQLTAELVETTAWRPRAGKVGPRGPGAYRIEDAARRAYRLSQSDSAARFSPDWERPCLPLEASILNLSRGLGWLVTGTNSVNIEPLSAPVSQSTSLVLNEMPLTLELEWGEDRPALLEISAVSAGIGVNLSRDDGTAVEGFSWTGMDRRQDRAFTAVPGIGRYRIKLWQTAAEPRPERVRLVWHKFHEAKLQTGPLPDQSEILLAPGQAYVYSLAENPRQWEILLAKGTAAFSWWADRPDAVAVAESDSRAEIFSTQSGSLFLLNLGESAKPCRIRGLSSDAGVSARNVDAATGFETLFTHAGQIRLDIPGGGDRNERIFTAGDEIQTRFFSNKGHLFEGDPPVSASADGGQLEIVYGPGFVKVWRASTEHRDQAFAGGVPKLPATDLGPAFATLDAGEQSWRFSLSTPHFVSIAANTPGITALFSSDRMLDIAASGFPAHRELSAYLPAGEYRILTRPFATQPATGETQTGTLVLLRQEPVPLEDGRINEPRLIGHGERHVYRFQVAVGGEVGAGFKADADGLEGRILDFNNRTLAEGVFVFTTLTPGQYLLVVENPGQPIAYQPMVLGLNGPGQAIPAEIIEGYRRGQTNEQPATAANPIQ